MDQSLEVTNKNESTASDRLENPTEIEMRQIKQEDDCLVQSEIYVKTEPHEYESGFPVIAGTSNKICFSDDINFKIYESVVKIECKDLSDEITHKSLDVGSKKPVVKSLLIDLDQSESVIKTKTIEVQKDEHLLETLMDNSHGNGSNQGQDQMLFGNDLNCKYKIYICNECCKIFKGKTDLDRHLRVHTGEKPFACSICKKSFSQKGILDRHMFIHCDEKPHVCDVCNRVFNRKSALNEHKLIHTNSKKTFSCKVCNKSFRKKQDLARHERIHTNDKPYICDVCSKAFTDQSNLIRHRRLHTGEKPYSCNICNKSFTDKTSLKYHTRTFKH